jgi:hypothetical protein
MRVCVRDLLADAGAAGVGSVQDQASELVLQQQLVRVPDIYLYIYIYIYGPPAALSFTSTVRSTCPCPVRPWPKAKERCDILMHLLSSALVNWWSSTLVYRQSSALVYWRSGALI